MGNRDVGWLPLIGSVSHSSTKMIYTVSYTQRQWLNSAGAGGCVDVESVDGNGFLAFYHLVLVLPYLKRVLYDAVVQCTA